MSLCDQQSTSDLSEGQKQASESLKTQVISRNPRGQISATTPQSCPEGGRERPRQPGGPALRGPRSVGAAQIPRAGRAEGLGPQEPKSQTHPLRQRVLTIPRRTGPHIPPPRMGKWYSRASQEPGQTHLEEVKTEGVKRRLISHRYAGIQPLRPRHPLINQGATCYLSSILQVLFMTPEFHHKLNPSNTLDQQLELTFNNLKEGSCGTENITDSLGIKNVYQQRDAAECLERILNKVSPEASQVFKGQLKDTTRCSNGHMIIEETSPFFTLPLSLQGGHEAPCSLKTSFSEFFLRTEHTGDDMVYCTECSQKTEGSSGYEMVDSPQIMTLLLKRFYFDFNTMSDMKSNCCVEVPFKIQMMNKSYTLYGMVNHMGSLGGGHYTATVRSREDNTWYHCDDTQVEQQEFGSNETYSSGTVYLLMYRGKLAET
ncbi:probable ubiquitin carboxyl-terminal hydrolase 5 isoform X2 [Salarias fasciatus]|uniref:probable ubiquitin carboxyl-terminal hydrolase 5 isoform X2 n=1 Tax=Salarias fasciatus TaxID=181472 RepID=UPI001176D2D0|nr:probable ubiquitin carboxyl-terminal hydrolase 5 isoform X2 [Salarias fasciatus]